MYLLTYLLTHLQRSGVFYGSTMSSRDELTLFTMDNTWSVRQSALTFCASAWIDLLNRSCLTITFSYVNVT